MQNRITARQMVSPLVLVLALALAGCQKGHSEKIQDHGPDQLPLRLQLPKDGAAESLRIVQYAPDNITRRVQQSALVKGPYAGGRQVRGYGDDNLLTEIITYFPHGDGQPEQLAYVATFADGFYQSEKSFRSDGTRATDGHRLSDETFEENSFYAGGTKLFKHAIFGRIMNGEQKLEWKQLSAELYRQDDSTLAAVVQLMDDGGVFSQFYDEHHFLTETLYVSKDGKPLSETDYAKDGKTPVLRYDFQDKTAWTFDQKGQVLCQRKWGWDDSQEVTFFKDGTPIFTQHWEVDSSKSDKSSAPPKLVYYLSWVKELRPDGNVAKQINYWNDTNIVQTIDLPEAPPAGAKFKPAPALTPVGSSTPAKNWVKPAAGTVAAAVAPVVPAATAFAAQAVSPFWTPSGAHVQYTYSTRGFLLTVASYKAGQDQAYKTETHQEREHLRAKVDLKLIQPLEPGVRPSDTPKDPSPTMVDASADDFD